MPKDEALELERFSAHPWVRRKAELAAILLARYGLAGKPLEILEIGCGPGHNLARLREHFHGARLTGLDLSPQAVWLCREKAIPAIRADFMHYAPGKKFDVILMMDFLEHMERDEKALERAGAMLKKGGILVCSVPANPGLFGEHDRRLGHWRRYGPGELEKKGRAAGFDVLYAGHWNMLLYPAAWTARKLKLGQSGEKSELERSAGWMSMPLDAALGFENLLVGAGARLPFGLSAVAVLRKK